MAAKIIKLSVSKYRFAPSISPYDHPSTDLSIELSEVADCISSKISTFGDYKKLLVRGIQSGKHDLDRDTLVSLILEQGVEYQNPDEPNTIFAAPYSRDAVEFILNGFHKFKPKSEERPQYPVDLWLVFDKNAYENIEYLHPRHKVLVKDKWKRKIHNQSGLIGIILVN